MVAKEHELALFDAVQGGKAEAFARVFDQYSARIYRYLRSLVGDAALAEDLAQDTFVKAYKALAGGSAPDNLNAWLYAIATNTAISALRRHKLISWLPLHGNVEAETKAVVEDHGVSTGEKELIRQAMARLPKADAACLLLRFEHGFSYEELADVLGTTVPAAKMRLSRARSAFREAYLRLSEEVGR